MSESAGPPQLERPTTEQLDSVAATLEELSHSFATLLTEAAAREQDLAMQVERLELILQMTKELSGNGSPAYVAETAARTARSLSNAARVAIWLVEPSSSIRLVSDTDVPHGADLPFKRLFTHEGALGSAATTGQICTEEDPGTGRVTRVWPLVIGARIIGVLELEEPAGGLDSAVQGAVTTLAAHTASALEAARLQAENAVLARLDPLTLLPNRRSFNEDLAQEHERCERYRRPVSLLLIDLDGFKKLNDTYGHLFGDEVLQRVAATVSSSLRKVDTAYRVGGEELAVIARETDLEGAIRLAERLRSEIEATLSIEKGDPTSVTASFGVAELAPSMPSNQVFVAAADAALYRAKRAGRNRVVADVELAAV